MGGALPFRHWKNWIEITRVWVERGFGRDLGELHGASGRDLYDFEVSSRSGASSTVGSAKKCSQKVPAMRFWLLHSCLFTINSKGEARCPP